MLLVEALAAKLGCQVDKISFAKGAKAINSLVNSANKFTNSLQEADAANRSWLGTAVKGIGAYAAAMTGFVASTVKASQSAKSTALATGLTTQAIQELHYAARVAGVETATLDTALTNLGKKAYLASRKEIAAAKVFYMAGIDIRDDKGELKATDVLLEDMAERFQSFGKTQQIALAKVAAESLGSSKESIMLLLSKGKQGLRELRREAIASGTIIPKETLTKAEETRKSFVQLQMVLRGISYQIGTKFLEEFTDALRHLSGWLRKNRTLVITTITAPMKALVKVVKFLTENIEDLKAAIGTLLIYKAFLLLLPTTFGRALFGAVGLGSAAKAAFIAMGTALKGFLVKMGPLLVMSLLLYSIFDEIITMFRGGKTVIGSFVEQLNRLIDLDWDKLNAVGKLIKVLAYTSGYTALRQGSFVLSNLQQRRNTNLEEERTRRALIRQGKWDYRQDLPQMTPPVMKPSSSPAIFGQSLRTLPPERKTVNTVNATFNIQTGEPQEVSNRVQKNMQKLVEDLSLDNGGLYPSYVEDAL